MKFQTNSFSYKMKSTNYFFNEGLKEVHKSPINSMLDFNLDGENLCISILNYNRVELTIKLLQSIEKQLTNYKGDVVIIDNKSAEKQLKKLEAFISTLSLKVEIKKLDENHGVGRARNIAAKSTTKDWIMFLDSDMFFINNPLKQIQETIQELGVHYLNLPIIDYNRESVFALGGALFMSPSVNELIAGGGSVFNLDKKVSYREIEFEGPFLSDFLFGGSAVINRESFLQEEGFDYDMFIGFEDVDFSFRLYKKGFKIGNAPIFSLVHDHKITENKDDLEAEKTRYSNKIIEESGAAFYKKHGIKIYDNNTKDWLNEKQKDILNQKSRENNSDKKPSIILVIDKRNWAFHNIANNIKLNLSTQFDIEFLFGEDYQGDNWLDLYSTIYDKKPDIAYFFWRPQLFLFNKSDVVNGLHYRHKIEKESLYQFFNETILLTSVYDHLYSNEEGMKAFRPEFENFIDGYTVSSEILNTVYSKDYPLPNMVIQDGVDLEKFYPKPNVQLPLVEKQLTVGWVGNSKWGMNEDGLDHKGLETLIKPAVEQLKAEGHNVILKYADSTEPKTKIAHENMVDFYNLIDVYICMSDIEGTPNTVLETMACGRAVISTAVGIVPEVFGKKQKVHMLQERTVDSLKKSILTLYSNPMCLKELATENLIRIESWTWKNKCNLFEIFFINKLNAGPKTKFHISEKEGETNFSSVKSDSINTEEYRLISQKVDSLTTENEELGKKLKEEKEWYYKEYEVLPLWFKRIGHLIKIITGKRK